MVMVIAWLLILVQVTRARIEPIVAWNTCPCRGEGKGGVSSAAVTAEGLSINGTVCQHVCVCVCVRAHVHARVRVR